MKRIPPVVYFRQTSIISCWKVQLCNRDIVFDILQGLLEFKARFILYPMPKIWKNVWNTWWSFSRVHGLWAQRKGSQEVTRYHDGAITMTKNVFRGKRSVLMLLRAKRVCETLSDMLSGRSRDRTGSEIVTYLSRSRGLARRQNSLPSWCLPLGLP